MCPSSAQTCSLQDIYGNTTTCCGFHPRLGLTSEEKRLMTVVLSWRVMTGALWRSMLKDATPQVPKQASSVIIKELYLFCIFYIYRWSCFCFFQCVWSWTYRVWRWTPSSSHSMSMTWRVVLVWVSVLMWSSRPRWRTWCQETKERPLLLVMMRQLSAPTHSGL